MPITRPFVLAVAAGLVAAAALAQPAAGPGPAASRPMGPGPMGAGGMGPGHMGPRFGSGVTPGWSMMTPEEREAHRQAMTGAKTHDECAAARDKHHADMQARAKERGTPMPAAPHRDVCAGLPKR